MNREERNALYMGAMINLDMDSLEVDEALEQAGLTLECDVQAAVSACRQWKDKQSGRVMRESIYKPVERMEPYKNIKEAAKGYCRESPELGKIVKRENEEGILFTGPDASPDDEFISFSDLGYNSEIGFFQKSALPRERSIYD